jgi:hypothetical protein
MVNYNNGKIYKIVDNTNGDIYIGSTTKQCLSYRLAEHVRKTKTGTNKCTSRHIIANGDYSIVLIELYPCNSKDELNARERHHIENTVCINRCIPTRTPKEYHNDYYLINREHILKSVKNYNDTHKEEKIQYYKQYYEAHKEERRLKHQESYTCECGTTLRKSDKARHCKSKKHISYIESLAI